MNVHAIIFARVYIFFTAIILGGCTSAPIQADKQTGMGHALPTLTPPAGLSTLVIVRPSLLDYALRDLTITAGDTIIAKLPNNSFTRIYVKPGSIHLVGEGGFMSWPRKEITLELKKDEVKLAIWHAEESTNNGTYVVGNNVLSYPSTVENIGWVISPENTGVGLLNDMSYVPSIGK